MLEQQDDIKVIAELEEALKLMRWCIENVDENAYEEAKRKIHKLAEQLVSLN